jgi:adenylate cyclase
VRRGDRLGQRWQRINAPLVASAIATAICAGVYAGHRAGIAQVPGLDAAEAASIDARFRLRGRQKPRDDQLAIVGLDEVTRRERPDIVQTRRGWARLIEAIAAGRPSGIAIDAFFANPEVNLSRETVARVRQAASELRAETGSSPAAQSALAALSAVIDETRGDELLADAIRRAGNVTLAFAFELADDRRAARGPSPSASEAPGIAAARFAEAVSLPAPASRRPATAARATASLPSISRAAIGAGFVNTTRDPDGHVRRAPLVIEHGGRFYKPLALSLAGGGASYVTGDAEVKLGDTALPVDPRGNSWLSYLGPAGTFPHVSAADLVAGRVDPRKLRDKLVLVGYTDPFRDTLATPFDPLFPGVEYHATLLHNIRHGELLRRSGAWASLLTVLALGAAIALLQVRRVRHGRTWIVGAGAAALALGYAAIAQLWFSRGVVIDVVGPGASLVAIALTSLSAGLATEGREKARLRGVLSQYVQDTVVERILADPRRATVLGGVRRELTVLFSDIRGFSRISEHMEPEVLSEYLNQYFTPMTRLILDADGLLDKYIGDAVMAVYGAPLEQPDHAARACRTALSMLAALGPLNDGWRGAGLAADVAIGIGINTGPMAVGNMGSEARFDYTVLGDAVNLGARLEALTKDYGVKVLCGPRTADAAGAGFVFRELDTVRVKGRAGTAPIFELVGEVGAAPLGSADLDLYATALAAYRRRDWDAARSSFTDFLSRHPTDGPAKIMVERIDALRQSPTEREWDGVFEQQTK